MKDTAKTDTANTTAPAPAVRRPSQSGLELSLRPGWKGVFPVAVVLALGGWMAYQTARIAFASAPLDSISILDVKAGLAHDPANSALLHHLGLLYASSPIDLDLNEAQKYLHQAVAMEPRHWDYWADLATTCDTVGDTACADAAFAKSRALNPHFPRLAWVIGNHYILTDRLDKAFPYFRQLLEEQPQYQGPTFRLCLRAAGDPNQVYAQVIPQGLDPSVRFAFLNFLCVSGDVPNAMRIWAKMIAGPDRAVEASAAKSFLDFLINHNQIHEALTVWSDLTRMGSIPREENPDPRNLFYNAEFKLQPFNLGFDWRYSEGEDLLYDFADMSAPGGGHCLRIEFPIGRDADYDLLGQLVPVKPNTKYQLTAMIRSEGLTSNSGPRFRVVFWGCADCSVPTSDQTLGTTHWHPEEVTFFSPPGIQAVRISLWRPLGRLGSQDITGTIWVDQVRLRLAEPARSRAARFREQ